MTLNGIDVSGYQPANIGDLVPYDFLIAKATEGTTYVSGRCDQQVQSALSKGKLAGVYHFANGGSSGAAEAEAFVKAVRGYVGKAMLVLDWEASAVAKGPSYAKAFLDRVHELTGVRPVIYMSASVVNAYDWSAVRAADYGLWVASYGSNGVTGYRQPGAPAARFWGAPIMFQYGSQGRLSGYGSNLDVDVFYGDADAWRAFAAVNGKVTLPAASSGTATPATQQPVNLTTYSWAQIQGKIGAATDGVPGPETLAKLKAWQTAHKLTADGIVGPATAAAMFGKSGTLDVDGVWGTATTKALQAALGVAVDGKRGPATIKAQQKRTGATADGIDGPNTRKALQRYLGVAQDGIVGPNTVRALQTRLNAGTF